MKRLILLAFAIPVIVYASAVHDLGYTHCGNGNCSTNGSVVYAEFMPWTAFKAASILGCVANNHTVSCSTNWHPGHQAHLA